MPRQTRTNTAASVPHARPAPKPVGDSAVGGDVVEPGPGQAAPEEAHRESWELVHAAQGGDKVAFGKLYDRYVDVVFRYALFRVGDRELAEDVTSETFLRALRRITSVTYQGRDVGAWFVTIARNLILDHVKSSRYKLEVATPEFRDSERDDPGPEQQVLSMATRDALLRCVDQLGDDQRECIVLRFLQGLSVAETAEIMNRNEGAVKALQHRAVRRLAQLLPTGLR
ncbi:sigma-70 family RNA polymerase sigma factor [Actinokineospora pegani]|uniref:sigma-70 family RNA polymerase sigma factor n=1 Tax=Actinokineospora pegani TaxID=2654637 RepID=UPI0012EA6005|nr:sigma-70 family RNA polymerase sigma factor [Actinokineospora pegani]